MPYSSFNPIGGSGGGTPITTKDEGITLTTATDTLNFVGAGVTASGGPSVTVTIPSDARFVTFFIDGAGGVLGAGIKNPIKIPYGGTLIGWTMMCSPSGSVTADILRAANNAGLPVTSIVGGGGTKPAIASNTENSSISFTGWTSTVLAAKDNLALNLSGIVNVTYCELTLYFL